MMDKVNVGILGCGVISETYLKVLELVSADAKATAVADRILPNAILRAEQFGIPTAVSSIDELVARPDVDLVVILTPPEAHYEVARTALLAGKHVYTEKPLAVTYPEGLDLVRLARASGLQIVSAPDTILGDAIQTARRALDDGAIGRPFGFVAHALWAGPASWHPAPAFLYRKGAGPVLDSAPYSIAALVYLLGRIQRVVTMGSRPFTKLEVGSGPRAGEQFDVTVDTFTTSILELENGVVGTAAHSMSVPRTRLAGPDQKSMGIEIYGTEGTIALPGPAFHDGPVYYSPSKSDTWEVLPSLFPELSGVRGIGVAEMANSIRHNIPSRISMDTSLHIFEALARMDEPSDSNTVQVIESDPAPRGEGLRFGIVDGRLS